MKHYLMTLLVLCLASIMTACFMAPKENYKVKFVNDPCIEPYRAYTYTTCSAIGVIIYSDQKALAIQIPQDFNTDLATIPRWLWSFISPARSDLMGASILHDYLYGCHMGYTRSQVDKIFLSALIGNGVSSLRAYPMYLAVRIFGSENFDDGRCMDENQI